MTRGQLVMLIGVGLMPALAHADVQKKATLIGKVLTFERTLVERASGELAVVVVHARGTARRRARRTRSPTR